MGDDIRLEDGRIATNSLADINVYGGEGVRSLSSYVVGVPVLEFGLSSGEKLQRGDHLGMVADFSTTVAELLTLGAGVTLKAGLALAREAVVAKTGKELFKFGGSAGRHMAEPGRAVPIQILEQAIKGSKGVADPKGSRDLMHSVELFRNGKPYKLDVLYDKATNTNWHFQYSPIKP